MTSSNKKSSCLLQRLKMSSFLKQLDVANDFLYGDVDEDMPLELPPYVEPTKSIQV